MNNYNKEAIKEILKGIKYIVDKEVSKTTKCYDGIIKLQEENKWYVQFNGETHCIPHYGEISTPAVGKMVKVIIPQNNVSLAFFI